MYNRVSTEEVIKMLVKRIINGSTGHIHEFVMPLRINEEKQKNQRFTSAGKWKLPRKEIDVNQ